jgi:hypothetical protein
MVSAIRGYILSDDPQGVAAKCDLRCNNCHQIKTLTNREWEHESNKKRKCVPDNIATNVDSKN